MRFIITGRRTEVSPELKVYVEKKLGKLSKFFKDSADIKVTFTPQKDKTIVEATIFYNGIFFRGEEIGHDPHACIDRLVDVIERQIRKNKTRLEKKLHEKVSISDRSDDNSVVPEEQEFKIVRTKTYDLKPMSPEEAILQMNLLGHNFFIFSDAKSNSTCIVYKRKEDSYGLIETNDLRL